MDIRDGGAWENGITRASSITSITLHSLDFFHGYASNEGGCLVAKGNIDLHISDSKFRWCVASLNAGAISTNRGVVFKMERTKVLHNVGKAQAGGIALRGENAATFLKE